MKKSLYMLIGITVFFGVIGLIAMILPIIFNTLIEVPWLRSVIILVVFTFVQIIISKGKDFNDKNNNIKYLLIFIFIFIGVFVDTQGNYIYNKPLQWIVSTIGDLKT